MSEAEETLELLERIDSAIKNKADYWTLPDEERLAFRLKILEEFRAEKAKVA